MVKKYLKKGRGGFSLIELLIILAILAILASVAIPAYTNYQSQAKIKAVIDNWDAAVRYASAEIAKRNISLTTVTTDAVSSLSLNGNKKNPFNTSLNAFIEASTLNSGNAGTVYISTSNIQGASSGASITIQVNSAGNGATADKTAALTVE